MHENDWRTFSNISALLLLHNNVLCFSGFAGLSVRIRICAWDRQGIMMCRALGNLKRPPQMILIQLFPCLLSMNISNLGFVLGKSI